jgi:hypothetical protein
MATLSIPYSFVNGTTAVAAEVNGNFTAVKTFVEGIAAGTNIDAGAITFASIATAAITSITSTVLTTAGSDDQVVLGSQVFG